MGKVINITGNRYGRLSVVRISDEKANNRGTMWVCQCDCGKTTVVSSYSLRSGRTNSCGCLQKEIAKRSSPPPPPPRKNLTGISFGKLTVIKRSPKRGATGEFYWECICDCGNSKIVPQSSLVKGATISCGCEQEKNNKRIREKQAAEHVENTLLCNLTSKLRTDNTSGHKGVYRLKRKQRWVAYINFQRKRYYLGEFKNYEDAVKARELAEERYFKPILDKYGRSCNPKNGS